MTRGAAQPAPRRLSVEFKPKIWGATRLAPWFTDTAEKTGEAWFTDAEALPLLVKFLFTSEKLSVQVHPDDEFAARHERSPGKTEMWHVLRAEPGASVALGLLEPVSGARLREASLNGEIERLLAWREVSVGDSFFVPPGTIHAIGAGLALCEVQQPSDVTYRLYDYGRPRELHLEKAIAVSRACAHPGRQTPVAQPGGAELLAECPYFRVLKRRIERPYAWAGATGAAIAVVLEGSGVIAGEPFRAGEAWLIAPGAAPFEIAPHAPVALLEAISPGYTVRGQD